MSIERTAIFAVALALAVSGALAAPPAFAQAVDEAARDTIIGSEVGEEEVAAAAEPQRVIAAIDRTPENIPAVRKTIRLDRVEIVFLADAAATEGGPPPEIAAKVEERKDEIAELRKELEGNAMLYHASDSRQVLVRDVLAVEFDGAGVLIYAAAKPPAG
jgi:hypothetical protein